jgi:hypothetical protein
MVTVRECIAMPQTLVTVRARMVSMVTVRAHDAIMQLRVTARECIGNNRRTGRVMFIGIIDVDSNADLCLKPTQVETKNGLN